MMTTQSRSYTVFRPKEIFVTIFSHMFSSAVTMVVSVVLVVISTGLGMICVPMEKLLRSADTGILSGEKTPLYKPMGNMMLVTPKRMVVMFSKARRVKTRPGLKENNAHREYWE